MDFYKRISKMNKSALNSVGLLNDKMSKDILALENLENNVQHNNKVLKSNENVLQNNKIEQVQNEEKFIMKSVTEASKNAVVNINPQLDTNSEINVNKDFEKMVQKEEITKEKTIKGTIKNLLFNNEQLKSENLSNKQNGNVINSVNLNQTENLNKEYIDREKENKKLGNVQNFKINDNKSLLENFKEKEPTARYDNKNDKRDTTQNKKIDINIVNNNTIANNLDIDDIVTEITKKLSESVKNLSEGIS